MAPLMNPVSFGEPVVPRWQLDPRQDRLGLYLWGTIVWHLLILIGTVLLIFGGHAVWSF